MQSVADGYLRFLAAVLAGYAVIGKGFAYLGYPPLYIGEIALLAGAVVFLRTRSFVAIHASVTSLLLIMNLLWVLFRTLPYVPAYGVDALRDSVVITYGGLGLIVLGLLLDEPRRLNDLVGYYAKFVPVFVPVVCVTFLLSHYLSDSMPHMPGTDVPLIRLHPTEVAVHLTGVVVFALIGFRKLPLISIAPMVLTLCLASALSRGAMLAFIIPVSIATLVLGKIRDMAVVLSVGIALFLAAYFVEAAVTDYREAKASETRFVSTQQIVNNVASISGRAGAQTDATKQWRLRWWETIVSETFEGPYFWSGRGFGINLAEVHGFRGHKQTERPLRSPHNAHLTILARGGIPGLTLWFVLLGSWFWTIIHAFWDARRRNQADWSGLFLFLACYVGSAVINASFDVALEGPMQGLWFWCLFGFGIASVMIYRAQPVTNVPSDARLAGGGELILKPGRA